jgi:ABC-type phosphate/phosphonate transport system substrate-binding protein
MKNAKLLKRYGAKDMPSPVQKSIERCCAGVLRGFMEAVRLRRQLIIAIRLIFVSMSIFFCAQGQAQDFDEALQSTATVVFSRARTFRIGYLRVDPESPTSSGVFQKLREFLLKQPPVQDALKAKQIDDIMIQSFDSHRLLVEAMDGEQVDLAFCSVLDYAYQRGDYEPIFQMRRPGDPHNSVGDSRVWHSGVIFVNNRSALFNMNTSAAIEALPQYLESHEMAMVGSSSAAGYVYPYLALSRITTSPAVLNGPSVFWDSSSEVVKAVVNGIQEIGACDATALPEVLGAYGLDGRQKQLLKEILRTDPVPRDPVVMEERWIDGSLTDEASSALGRQISRGVQAFFERTPGLPRLEPSTRQPFVEVKENLKRFQTLRQGVPSASGS